jgi:PPP family 3-phenylpropionic acid transporter
MEKNPVFSPKNIIRTQYFLYFGVMGIFLPYFNLYCFHLHFTGFQIGLLSAAKTITMIIFPLMWGALADRFNARRPIYILCNIASTAAWALFLGTTDFIIMLGITLLYGVFYAPIISLLEAFTLDVLGKEKKRYGQLRAWGSISFIVVVFSIGRLMDIYPVGIIVLLILCGSFLQAFGSLKIPHAPIPPPLSQRSPIRLLLKPKIIIFLMCGFLMLVSHGAYYGFFSIHLEKLGYDKTFIGLAWALASIAEILVMMKSDTLFKRFDLETVLFFSFGVATLRWLILFSARAWPVLLLSQLLHAITYGTFHIASILYIDRMMPDGAKSLGQAANNAMTYGMGLMAGFLISGYLYEKTGIFTLFALSGLIAMTAGLMFKCLNWAAGDGRT